MVISFFGTQERRIQRAASKLQLTPRQFVRQAVDRQLASIEGKNHAEIPGDRPHGRGSLGG